MRYMNLRFSYLLTYLHTRLGWVPQGEHFGITAAGFYRSGVLPVIKLTDQSTEGSSQQCHQPSNTTRKPDPFFYQSAD